MADTLAPSPPPVSEVKTQVKAGTQGIVMLAVGNPAYGKMAFNLAVSIAYHSPKLRHHIQLVCDEKGVSHLNGHQRALFDLTWIDQEDITIRDGNRVTFAPAKGKLALYKYLKFDRSIYLDVDAILVKDLSPVFEETVQNYHAQTSATFLWLEDNNKLKSHFGVDSICPINSSFQYIEKSEEAESIYTEALNELNVNPLPIKDHTQKWYFGQPDELYMNVVLARREITPQFPVSNPLYCRWNNETGPKPTFTDIQRGHYLIGFWGHPGQIWRELYRMYNAEMSKYMRELYGQTHIYKLPNLLNPKR